MRCMEIKSSMTITNELQIEPQHEMYGNPMREMVLASGLNIEPQHEMYGNYLTPVSFVASANRTST